MTDHVSVVIARFQVPYLHHGHRGLLEHAAKFGRLTVLLGVAARAGVDNPLSYEIRREMLEGDPGLKIRHIFPISDVPGNNELWSKNVDTLLRLAYPYSKITLYGGRSSFIGRYKGTLQTLTWEYQTPTWEYNIYPKTSGTDLRDQTAAETVNSVDFRKGIIWAVTNYAQFDSAHGQLQNQPLAPVSTWNDRGL